MINVGVIGLGRLGRVYATDLAHRVPNARLLAVADEQDKLAEKFAKENNIDRWYTSHHDLVSDKEIDAVAIITPTNTHKEVVISAAECGKAIFCEKPISISLEESEEIIKVLERTGVFFQLGFQRRFDRGHIEARKKIEAGLIGRPVMYLASSRDPFAPPAEFCDPAASGGLILDMGIHDFDMARLFMGEVESVNSIGGALVYDDLKKVGDIDNAIITLKFENGSLGVIDVSRNAVYGYDIRAEIFGSTGSLKIGHLRETPLTVMTKQGVTHDVVPHFMERFGEAYFSQIKNFVDNVHQEKEPEITAADGIAALIIGLAATHSYHKGTPINLHKFREGKY